MTANRRIVLNFIATYGRSLFSLACGLFSGRWILAALGQVDYGLWGVVGGLTAFVVFFNELMAGAVSRFYAVSVGQCKAEYEVGIRECREWFSIAVVIHTILPIILVAVGYPIGVWAVKCFLTIPSDRVIACIWVWRSVCVSCFVAMINVPFRAMYVAKQEIAELTIYSILQTLVNILVAYYMVAHPGDWLAKYAGIVCASSLLPQLCICLRAFLTFPECKISFATNYRGRLRELGNFVLYRFWGAGASILQNQGVSILTNKYIGPIGNAAMTVGNTVASQTVTLSNAMSVAIGPAIYNAFGEGARNRVTSLALQASKIGTVLYLFVVLPAAVEVDYLMCLWLVNPPQYATAICLCVMCAYLTERMTDGQINVIYATGQIKGFQQVLCFSCLGGFLLAWLFLFVGWGIVGVGMSILCFKLIIMIMRCIFARRIYALAIRPWFFRLLLPTIVTSICCFVANLGLRFVMAEGMLRLLVSCVVVELIFLMCSYLFILDVNDKRFIAERIIKRIRGVG